MTPGQVTLIILMELYQRSPQRTGPEVHGFIPIDITFTYSGPTSISEIIKDPDYTIYPNPASNLITIKSKNSSAGSSYSITDQTGKMVLSGKLLEETTPVDITILNNGIYFLKIGDRSQPAFKVIKQDLK